jgi:solute carrier family 45 protein 1/2/4
VNNNDDPSSHRGLGGDIAIMGSMLFLAQLILSFSMGPLMAYLGSTAVVIYSASFCALAAGVAATQVEFLDL